MLLPLAESFTPLALPLLFGERKVSVSAHSPVISAAYLGWGLGQPAVVAGMTDDISSFGGHLNFNPQSHIKECVYASVYSFRDKDTSRQHESKEPFKQTGGS